MVGEVPSDMAAQYTSVYWWAKKSLHYLHSYRWSAVSAVADAGATSDQMQYFFGWSNAKMNTEYISTSKAAIIKVVQKHQDAPCECWESLQEEFKSCQWESRDCPRSLGWFWTQLVPLAPDPIRVQSCVWCLFWTNRNCMAVTSIFLSSSLSN